MGRGRTTQVAIVFRQNGNRIRDLCGVEWRLYPPNRWNPDAKAFFLLERMLQTRKLTKGADRSYWENVHLDFYGNLVYPPHQPSQVVWVAPCLACALPTENGSLFDV